jgi:hypothetical protein
MADFLDQNTDFVACFHNAEIIFDDDSHPNQFVNTPDQKEIVTVEDFIGDIARDERVKAVYLGHGAEAGHG